MHDWIPSWCYDVIPVTYISVCIFSRLGASGCHTSFKILKCYEDVEEPVTVYQACTHLKGEVIVSYNDRVGSGISHIKQ